MTSYNVPKVEFFIYLFNNTQVDVFNNCFTDIWTEGVQRDGLDSARVCVALHIWRCEWSSLYIRKVGNCVQNLLYSLLLYLQQKFEIISLLLLINNENAVQLIDLKLIS